MSAARLANVVRVCSEIVDVLEAVEEVLVLVLLVLLGDTSVVVVLLSDSPSCSSFMMSSIEKPEIKFPQSPMLPPRA
jgi:hypothetical protein